MQSQQKTGLDGKRLNIVFIIGALDYGGAENFLILLAKKLHELGNNISVLCIRREGAQASKLIEMGIDVMVHRFKGRLHPRSLSEAAALLINKRPDIAQSFMYRSNISGLTAASIAKVPVRIATVCSMSQWDNKRQVITERLLGFNKNMTVAVSQAVAEVVRARLKIPQERLTVIHNAIDPAQILNAKGGERVRHELGLDNGDIVLTMVGRLVPRKDHQTLIKALPAVMNRYPRLKALFAGDGALMPKLKSLCAKLGISQRVIFAGNRDDIPDILNASNIFALISKVEGFSLALLEGMSAGLPVIATDLPCNREVVEHGLNGYLVDPGDSAGLAHYLETLLEDDKLARDMGKKAQETVLDGFTVEVAAQKHLQLYNGLLAGKGR